MTLRWESALRRGDLADLAQLLSEGADVNALDRYGQTSLMRAAHDGLVDVVRLLLARGARLDHTAKHHLTALMLAVIAGHDVVAEDLIQAGADLDVRGSGPGFDGKTALDLARAAGRVRIVARLEGR